MKHTLSVLVENKFGVLARVAGLFSARGFNICSLAVGETQDPNISQMSIVVDAPDTRILEQIIKQLHKLIDTISVIDLTKKNFIERELALVKVDYKKENQSKLNVLLRKHKSFTRFIKNDQNEAIIEVCTTTEEADNFLSKLKEFGIKELMRTGKVALK
jgi:acetolactate synthase-1/3 small subunit